MPDQYLKGKRKTSSSYSQFILYAWSSLTPDYLFKILSIFPFLSQVNKHTIIILLWHLKQKQGG